MVGCGAGRESLEWANLMKLIGLPQGYLNRLVTHFDEGLVDLPTWFRQPWSMYASHGQFSLVEHVQAVG